MLGFVLVIIAGAASGYFSYEAWGVGWSIVCTIVAMIVCWSVIGLTLRRFVGARQMKIQSLMQEAQAKVNRQLEIFNRRPPSSMKVARETLEKIQFDAIRKSLVELDGYKKYYIWNAMLAKQVNAMKIQLYYQLREYAKVDELLPKALLFDPQSIGIKMARMYKNDDPKLDKFYRLKCWRFKGESGAFLACVYAWIKVRQNSEDVQLALEALKNAAKSSDNQTLIENIDHLSNGKVKHFSNSGFGDNWYALALEEPKMKKQRQQQGRMF